MEPKKMAAIAVALVLVAAGVFFVFLDEPTGDEIGEQVEERYAAVDDYDGTMTVNSVRMVEGEQPLTEEEIQQEAEITAEHTDMTVEEAEEMIRAEQPDGGLSEAFNDTTVAEVSFTKPDQYRYDYVRSDTVDVPSVTTEDGVAYYHREDAPATETEMSLVSVTTVGIRMSEYVPTLTDDYDTELNETETDGETYVLDLTPADGADLDRPLDRLWVDREEMLPVKAYRRAEQTDAFGEPTGDFTEHTVEYDFEYDVGVDDDLFDVGVVEVDRPEPTDPVSPEGETEVDRPDERTTLRFDTVEEAEEEAGFEINLPDYVPSGYEVEQATVRREDGDTAIDLRYSDGDDSFLMRYTYDFDTFASDVPAPSPVYDLDEVEINDRTAEVRHSDEINVIIVSTHCGDRSIEISGVELPREELVDILGSVACDE